MQHKLIVRLDRRTLAALTPLLSKDLTTRGNYLYLRTFWAFMLICNGKFLVFI